MDTLDSHCLQIIYDYIWKDKLAEIHEILITNISWKYLPTKDLRFNRKKDKPDFFRHHKCGDFEMRIRCYAIGSRHPEHCGLWHFYSGNPSLGHRFD